MSPQEESTPAPVLVWLRRDLRLSDHKPLSAALKLGGPVVPVFVWDPDAEGAWSPGEASRWWLHVSLEQLAEELAAVGGRLVMRRGPIAQALGELAVQTGARRIFYHKLYEPAAREQECHLAQALAAQGVELEGFEGTLMHAPGRLLTGQGTPYKVFTPFWRAFEQRCDSAGAFAAPLGRPRRWLFPARWPASLSVRDLALHTGHPWTAKLAGHWEPGERGATRRLKAFLNEAVYDYATGRDRPDVEGVSRLSPHLHWGEISSAQVWDALKTQGGFGEPGGAAFARQLVWREFAHHLLFHFPHLSERPLRPAFENFPWREDDPERLEAWKAGRTGLPIVDAGLRQLWATGWMHNRVRMIVASLLVKDMMIHWRAGARWFWETLVDADLANNTLGWQWVAGCGADAAPFFRIFNPALQAAKFDPHGDYIRRWVPELAALPTPALFDPAAASPAVVSRAGVCLGKTYPAPIVQRERARREALAAYDRIKS